MRTSPATRAEPAAALTALLIDALRALDAAGQPEAATRLAGRAYAALRREQPEQAQRINALMHRLARMTEPIKEQTMPPPTRSSTSAPSRPPAATS